jgi:TctA family transporter
MNTTKPWWQSRTAWAAAVTVLAGLLGLAGVDLDARLQDELVTLLTGAAEIGAGIMAFIGRFQASKTLTWRSA